MSRYAALAIAAALILAACAAPPKAPVSRYEALVRISPSEYPDFTLDAGPPDTLAKSVSNTLDYLSKLPPDRTFVFGRDSYTAAELAASLSALHAFLIKDPGPDELAAYIAENFTVYRATGFDGLGSALMTGYYTPELHARREPGAGYFYPIYGVPDDLVSADLAALGADCDRDTVRGRVVDGRLVPYYTRAEIDAGALAGRGLELAWCNDPVDVFFLHVQGSGVLRFPDGTSAHVNYASQNGRAYRSIGKLLVDEGKADIADMSMDWLYDYLHEHPEELSRVLSHNESYVFFKMEDEGPYGSLDEPVTPGRSIATDKNFLPQGMLAFIVTEAPDFAGDSATPTAWEPYSRFVMNQDTGGAIKGSGRVDIYFGDDALAKKRAGHMRRFGEMYFLAGKR
jgi:peptidoglycan lytic transglycosylase A